MNSRTDHMDGSIGFNHSPTLKPFFLLQSPTAFALLGAFILLLVLLAHMALTRIENLTRTKTQTALSALLNTTQGGLNLWMEQVKKDWTFIAGSPKVLSFTKSLLALPPSQEVLQNTPAQKELRLFFKDIIVVLNGLGIFIISPDRISLASMRDTNVGTRNIIDMESPFF